MSKPKLTRVQRLDSIPLDETYWTGEGYLIDHPIVTSVGIFEYVNPDGSVRRELRLPENVFDPTSLASYKGKPVILTHDAGIVDKDNVDEENIGTILSEGYQDGNDVRCEIVIHDTDTMEQSGLRELSLGYSLDTEESPGLWKGQPYDAIQKNIRINHLALVDKARAGDQARLNIDSQGPQTLKGGKVMEKTRRDGGPMTPEDLAEAIQKFKERKAARAAGPQGDEDPASTPAPAADPAPAAPAPEENHDEEEKVQMVKDRRDRRDAEGDPETPDAAMGVIAQQDEDIDTLLEVIEALKAKQDFDAAQEPPANADEGDDPESEPKQDGEGEEKPAGVNADAADRIVRERIELVRLGDRLNLDGIDTMSVIEAKKAIIRAVNPTLRLDGKSPTYIKVAYDLAKDSLNTRKDANYQRRQMFGGQRARADAADLSVPSAQKAREAMIARQENGGKN